MQIASRDFRPCWIYPLLTVNMANQNLFGLFQSIVSDGFHFDLDPEVLVILVDFCENFQ